MRGYPRSHARYVDFGHKLQLVPVLQFDGGPVRAPNYALSSENVESLGLFFICIGNGQTWNERGVRLACTSVSEDQVRGVRTATHNVIQGVVADDDCRVLLRDPLVIDDQGLALSSNSIGLPSL